MTIRSNMVDTWNTLIASGEQIQSVWGDEANENLDDRVSKSLDPNQGIASNLIFASAKFPQMVTDPSVGNDATRKSWIDTNFLNKVSSTQQDVAAQVALATGKYVTVDNGKVLARWDADNPASATRRIMIGFPEICLFAIAGGGGAREFRADIVNKWADVAALSTGDHMLGLKLPDGATITAIRCHATQDGTNTVTLALTRHAVNGTGINTAGSIAITNSGSITTELNDTSISPDGIDNDNYAWYLKLSVFTSAPQVNIRSIQIDYTVVRPQP